MAERSIATAEALMKLSGEFINQNDQIKSEEEKISNKFNELLWNDPVGKNFEEKYNELKDKINGSLLKALEVYSEYLKTQAENIKVFNEDLLH